jgi:hypothetical protein
MKSTTKRKVKRLRLLQISRHRSLFKSVEHTSANPHGSQLTEEPCELNGMGSGPSPPTIPLANAFKAVEDLEVWVGAKALAAPASARRATVFMVDRL